MMRLSDECYLKETCWKYNNRECECKVSTIYCPRLFKMDYLFEESLMSVKQRQYVPLRIDDDGTDREAFKILKSIENNIEIFVSEGTNLYIYSSICGNGKTGWSLRLLQSYVNKIWHKSDLKCKILFINVPRFIIALKDSLDQTNDYINHIKKNIFEADIVVFDDIATKAATTFEREHILSLIDTRISLSKSNIYTSNVSPDELASLMGDRIASRVGQASVTVELKGTDKRGYLHS